jgi:hypothetical protein
MVKYPKNAVPPARRTSNRSGYAPVIAYCWAVLIVFDEENSA